MNEEELTALKADLENIESILEQTVVGIISTWERTPDEVIEECKKFIRLFNETFPHNQTKFLQSLEVA